MIILRAIPGELREAALGTYTFQTQYSQNDAGIMAFTALAMLPALGAFLFAQRYLVAGAAGAVKG